MTKKIERVQSNPEVFVPNAVNAEIFKGFESAGKSAKDAARLAERMCDLLISANYNIAYLMAPKKEEVKELVHVGGQELTRGTLFKALFDNFVTGRCGANALKLLARKPAELDDTKKKPRADFTDKDGNVRSLTEKEYRGAINNAGHRDMGNFRRKLETRMGKTGSAGNVGKGKKTDDEIVADLLDRIFRKLTAEKTEMTGNVVSAVPILKNLASTLNLAIASDKE